jgi:hypothetical protein
METTAKTQTIKTDDVVKYLGRNYRAANILGSAIVLCDDQSDTNGGYLTVPASMVKPA